MDTEKFKDSLIKELLKEGWNSEYILGGYVDTLIKDILDSEAFKSLLNPSSLQLKRESKSFLNIKTLADLKTLYPNQEKYGLACENGFVHYFVNGEKVLTRALIV